MSGETGQRFATQADLQEVAAQMATQADLKELELDLRSRMVAQREQMRAGSRGAGVADFKRKLNRHADLWFPLGFRPLGLCLQPQPWSRPSTVYPSPCRLSVVTKVICS